MLMTFVMLVFTVTFVVIQNKASSLRNSQTDYQISALANVINTEVELAYKVESGYKKYFWIPEYINGEDYSVSLNDMEIKIDYRDQSHLSFLSVNRTNISGQISKGDNTIIKNESGIFLLAGKI